MKNEVERPRHSGRGAITDHSDLIERLRAACVGYPRASIAWPHRILHEAADALSSQSLSLSEAREEIERLKGLVAGIRECPQELDEAARAAFEAHYRLAYDLTRTGEWGNGYVHDGIEAMWKGWRECWPAAVAAARQRCADIVEDLIGDGESVRFALHAIRNPLERGGASSPSKAGIVWFGFDEGTGEFTGEYSTVRPHNTHGMVPFVRVSRDAVADDDLHDELVDQIELEIAAEALLDDEPGIASVSPAPSPSTVHG